MTNEKIEKIELEKLEAPVKFVPNLINDSQVHVSIELKEVKEDHYVYTVKATRKQGTFGGHGIEVYLGVQYRDKNGKIIKFTEDDWLKLVIPEFKNSVVSEVTIKGSEYRMQNPRAYGIRFLDTGKSNAQKEGSQDSDDEVYINDSRFALEVSGPSSGWHDRLDYKFYQKDKPQILDSPVAIRRVIEKRERFGDFETLWFDLGIDALKTSSEGTINKYGCYKLKAQQDHYWLRFPAPYVDHPEIGFEIQKQHPEMEYSPMKITAYWKNRKKNEKRDFVITLCLRVCKEEWERKPIEMTLEHDEEYSTYISTDTCRVVLVREDEQQINPKHSQVKIDSLVFSGGGVKGIAYAGVMEALKYRVNLENIKTVAGASAGALIALAYACKYTPDEMSKIIQDKINYKEFWDYGSNPEQIKNAFDYPLLHSLLLIGLKKDMFERYGLNTGKNAENIIKDIITGKILDVKKYNPKITFKELYEQTNIDLNVVVGDVSRKETLICNKNNDKTKDLPVWEAVLASMSIPFIFKPVDLRPEKADGPSFFVDGGVTNNYPLNHFTNPLGFILSTPEGVAYPHFEKCVNLGDFAGRFIDFATSPCYENLFQSKNQLENEKNLNRTVFIKTGGVNTIDFDIDATKKTELIRNGRNATNEYFDQWN